MRAFSFVLLITALCLSSCFKNEPKKETWKAAGSWYVDRVTIDYYNNNHLDSTTELSDIGFLMLTHEDDFMYENPYSYSLDGSQLTTSGIYSFLYIGNTWGITTGAKAFNVGNMDYSTGYVGFVGSLTVNHLSNKRFELQYVAIDPVSSEIKQVEVWKMKRKTH